MRQVSTASRLGEPQLITEAVEAIPKLTDPASVGHRVHEAYEEVGHLLNEEEDVALLADLLCADCPIVGVSRGFTGVTGFTRQQLVGCNCRVLLQGIPEVAISKSVRKNLRDFCRMCRMPNLEQISEVTSLQPNTRKDGSQFMNFFMVGRVTVHKRPYLLSLQRSVAEGLFVQLNSQMIQQVAESTRAAYLSLRGRLVAGGVAPPQSPPACAAASSGVFPAAAAAASPCTAASSSSAPGFSFFAERLQDHCLLLNRGETVMRREPQELATNCLVFGNQPVRHSAEGVYFAVRVDDSVATFEGLPVLGFTRRRPLDAQCLYPTVSRCLGASVLCGACGEAFARDKWEHFVIGFKPPPQEEVQSWSLQPHLPPHKRRAPVAVQAGDILGCFYGRDGRLQLWHNGAPVLDFDLGRPAAEDVDYYAVVDVCLSAYSLTILPTLSPTDELCCAKQRGPLRLLSSGIQPALTPSLSEERLDRAHLLGDEAAFPENIDAMVSHVVHNALVKKAIRKIVGNCKFCVTVADPRGGDFPLIAVSEAFEAMTGFSRSEILGVNCRFLNQGCPVSPTDLIGLRMASENGSAFTALLPNRKKSGEKFINLLDLRGLTIARHLETGEDLWYLVGIQADVTGLADSRIPEGHVQEFQEVALMIRSKLRKELSQLALDAAERFDRQLSSSTTSSQHDSPGPTWKLLEEPVWTSTVLSQQAVLDLAGPVRGVEKQQAAEAAQGLGVVRDTASQLGRSNAGMLLMSILAFAAGLLFGRVTRRR